MFCGTTYLFWQLFFFEQCVCLVICLSPPRIDVELKKRPQLFIFFHVFTRNGSRGVFDVFVFRKVFFCKCIFGQILWARYHQHCDCVWQTLHITRTERTWRHRRLNGVTLTVLHKVGRTARWWQGGRWCRCCDPGPFVRRLTLNGGCTHRTRDGPKSCFFCTLLPGQNVIFD
jgi:hypothetical protein